MLGKVARNLAESLGDDRCLCRRLKPTQKLKTKAYPAFRLPNLRKGSADWGPRFTLGYHFGRPPGSECRSRHDLRTTYISSYVMAFRAQVSVQKKDANLGQRD